VLSNMHILSFFDVRERPIVKSQFPSLVVKSWSLSLSLSRACAIIRGLSRIRERERDHVCTCMFSLSL
jgi:hypothetical protein